MNSDVIHPWAASFAFWDRNSERVIHQNPVAPVKGKVVTVKTQR